MNDTPSIIQDKVLTLNEQQQEAADTLNGALMIVAVAGSGKTTVLINRAANLVANGVDPERILMITFTKYAANNMKKRAIKLADKRCANIYASTFHSFYADMLRRFGGYIGIDPKFTILSSDGEVEDSISNTMVSFTDYGNLNNFPSLSHLRELYSYSINAGVSLSSLVRSDEQLYGYEEEIIRLYDIWVKEKNKVNNFTYDDLMLKMYELMQTEKGCISVASLFDYIMVDEYQDINLLQNKILTLLAKDHRNIAIVGDDYQAIYRFRGSSTKYIEQYEKYNQDAKRVTIDTNYRSSDEIIHFVNTVMENECHFGIEKEMKGIGRSCGPVKINHIEDEDDEIQHLVGEIIKSHNLGTVYSEMAVLAKTSKRFAKLEMLLMQNGIPYEVRGGQKFLDRDEIRDIKALLTCIINPYHNSTKLFWYRVLKELVPNVGAKTASKLCEDSETKDFLLMDKHKNNNKYGKELVKLDEAIKRVRNIEEESGYQLALKTLIVWYLDTRHYLIEISKNYKTESHRTAAYEDLDNRRINLEILLEIAEEYDSFTSLLDAISKNELVRETKDHICLSTVHSAKGLEWECVYMMDVIENVYPGIANSEEDSNECLRLFYVGMTRAKKRLTLYIPHYYMIKGCFQEVQMSPFIRSTVRLQGSYMEERTISRYDILHHQKLEFEMIPDTLYGINARSFLTETEWKTISHNVRKIGKCACCMESKEISKLDAHEIWDYDDKKHIQKLQDVIPVCDLCHATIHIGHSIKEGLYTEDELLEHYMKVNQISKEQSETCLQNARIKIGERNKYNWTQDQSSIKTETRRYLTESRVIPSDKKEMHYVRRVNYNNKEEFKEWCAQMNIKPRWDSILKQWGYEGPICEEAEKRWN